MAIAYPSLNVKIVGFMPGLSSPGGPSHQAIEDVALMRALPNMTIIDPADAVEIEQSVAAAADSPGPVYLRLKRGEIPVIFDDDYQFDVHRAQVIIGDPNGGDICIVAAGMMVAAAQAAVRVLKENGISAVLVNAPVIKPLDAATIVGIARRCQALITAENHTIIGGLGSAVAEALAEAGLGIPLRRIGIGDVFAESGSREFLFARYGLSVQNIVDTAWRVLAIKGPSPVAPVLDTVPGAYAPV